MKARLLAAAVVCAVAVPGLVGCGGSAEQDPGPASSPPPEPDDTTTSSPSSTGEDPSPTTGNAQGSGCALVSAATVSEVLGSGYVEADGTTAEVCLFNPANGGAQALTVARQAGIGSAVYDGIVTSLEQETSPPSKASPVAGVGSQAAIVGSKLSVTLVAVGPEDSLLTVALDNLDVDDASAEAKVTQLAQLVLGAG